MDVGLRGRRAVISGSTAGIGLAIAAGLAREGARVVVNGRTEQRVSQAMAEIRRTVPDAEVAGVAADLTTEAGAATLFAAEPEADVLVNNLGIFEPKGFFEIDDGDWRRFFEANVLSGVRLARHYAPGMKARGWGRILFISSESALNIPTEMIQYGTTKTAQLAVARGLAQELAATGVTVNAVLAGPTRSEGVETFIAQLGRQSGKSAEEMEQDFFREARPTSLLKRFLTPEEVANMVVYLSGAAASGTTGAAVRVDGGVVQAIV